VRHPRNSSPVWGLLLTLMTLLAVTGCGGDSADPESSERILLEKAIKATWGERDPATLTTYRQITHWRGPAEAESGPATEVEILVGPKGNYREVRRHPYGITEVFATDGETAWASVDGTVVPLSETYVDQRSLQPWLIEVSRLAPLRDADRFRLDHRGTEKLDDGTEVESLAVTSSEQPGLKIILQFDPTDHLVRRVALQMKGHKPERALRFDDYREVDGVQVAHRVLALLDEEPLKRQSLQKVEFEPQIESSLFSRPLDLNRDTIKDKGAGLNGCIASTMHDGDADEIFDTADRLRGWLKDAGMTMTGPLVITEDSQAEGEGALRVGIAVSRPDDATMAELKGDEAYRIDDVEAGRVLSLTHVGTEARKDLIARLRARALELELETAGEAIEIVFSPDRQMRQIQLPVR
jgi:effector-binding domain-containing protein